MAAFPRSGGSYAEYVVAPPCRRPQTHVALARRGRGGASGSLTAWGLVVETAHAHEGQRILIHAGSGGVGHFAVQLAAYFGRTSPPPGPDPTWAGCASSGHPSSSTA
jgi:NADPH:quinone reductase-like Zn-dependent oxidoreductase